MATPAPARRPALALTLLLDTRDFLASLKLTVVLLVFSMVLVFAGTLDQVNLGIWAAQEKYFRSFVVWLPVGQFAVPGFPGGYTIGGLLLLNLIAAHVYRFRFTWGKAGIWLTHTGLIVLLVGELLTGIWQEDFHLRLDEGQTKNYAESFRQHELVVTETTAKDFDQVVAIAETRLAQKTPVQHPALPFRVAPRAYYPNSTIHMRTAAPARDGAPQPNAGLGDHLTASPLPLTHRSDERNIPSAIVELAGPEGTIGTFLVSAHLAAPQSFEHAGRTWQIALRVKRSYQPFSLTLLNFSHDRYAGTEIPKNFSSRLRLTTPDGHDDREVLIYMNNPLRYAGLTFYQAGFENNDRTTILQVVRNPSWLIPYIACGLMTLGMTLQFSLHLFRFVRSRGLAAAPASAPAGSSADRAPMPAARPRGRSPRAELPATRSLPTHP